MPLRTFPDLDCQFVVEVGGSDVWGGLILSQNIMMIRNINLTPSFFYKLLSIERKYAIGIDACSSETSLTSLASSVICAVSWHINYHMVK